MSKLFMLLRNLFCIPTGSQRLLLPSAEIGESRRVLILGSLGVGKSSLVNMLIGRPVAPVSDDIGVAHAAVVEYPIPLREISGDLLEYHDSLSPGIMIRFYDTLGLEHHSSPWNTIKTHMKHVGGVSLVVYCMRRGRLTKDQVAHLQNIRKTFCRGGVPLVLVVTGFGHRRGSVEEWWATNGEELTSAIQFSFAGHVCINTWDPAHPSWNLLDSKYEEVQTLVRDMVIQHCKNPHSSQ